MFTHFFDKSFTCDKKFSKFQLCHSSLGVWTKTLVFVQNLFGQGFDIAGINALFPCLLWNKHETDDSTCELEHVNMWTCWCENVNHNAHMWTCEPELAPVNMWTINRSCELFCTDSIFAMPTSCAVCAGLDKSSVIMLCGLSQMQHLKIQVHYKLQVFIETESF